MNFVMYPVFVVFALGIFLMAIARADAVLLVAAALVGVGYGTYMSCAQVIAVRLAPSSRVGLATSTFFGIADLGMGVGPVLWGALIPIIDYRGVYLAVALTIATSMVLYHVLCGRTAKI
jgi:MFS family permease